MTQADNDLSEQRVKWVGSRRIDLSKHPRPILAAPVRILRDAFADGIPKRDLVLSPDHAVFIDNKFICIRQLINGTTIRQEVERASVVYYHIELDRHAILLAEGLPAESYLNTGNRGFFAAAAEPRVLYPDLIDGLADADRASASCAPFVFDEVSVQPIWQHLAERAGYLGLPVRQIDMDSDPELQIVVQGRTSRPVTGKSGRHVFVLSNNASTIRVVSRSGRPTNARPWAEDRRDLGIYVQRITLTDRTGEVQDIPLDHPGLSVGWWALEKCDVLFRRWTDGDAILPLPAFMAPAMLEIHASSENISYSTRSEPVVGAVGRSVEQDRATG